MSAAFAHLWQLSYMVGMPVLQVQSGVEGSEVSRVEGAEVPASGLSYVGTTQVIFDNRAI